MLIGKSARHQGGIPLTKRMKTDYLPVMLHIFFIEMQVIFFIYRSFSYVKSTYLMIF